jgi:hypothetical protein
MKSVVAFAVALSLVVCSSAVAANSTVKKLQNTKSQNMKSQSTVTWQVNPTWPTSTTSQNTNKSQTTNWSQNLLKVSQEGFDAMRCIRAARLAIFNGQTDVATDLLNKAKTNLEAAAKDAPTFVTTTQTTVNGNVVAGDVAVVNMNWVPIDGQVSLADALVASPSKTQHIKNANKHFKNGQSNNAVEELHLAAIDVNCSRVLMSLTATTVCVSKATKLMSEQKYYQANLVLKTAEDGLVLESANVLATPNTNAKGSNNTKAGNKYFIGNLKNTTKNNTNTNSNSGSQKEVN